MPTVEELTGKPHLSYSSLSSYLQCGERYRLEKVEKKPQAPKWYLIGGSAVHKATENLDGDPTADAEAAFKAAWAEELKAVLDAGWTKADIGNTKGEADVWWLANGYKFVKSWVKWRDQQLEAGWSLLHVEVDFDLTTAGDTHVHGFIDRVMVDENGTVVVIDLKTGAREPDSSLQLATYSAGLEAQHGITADWGAYWMARRGRLGKMHDLSSKRTKLPKWYDDVRRGIEGEIFVPNAGPLCNHCSVSEFCSLNN